MTDPPSMAPQREEKFEDNSKGWASRWKFEFDAAKKEQERFWIAGRKNWARYLDDTGANRRSDTARDDESRLNFYSANVITQESLLYGKTPKVNVTRRFADAQDKPGAMAAELLERVLDQDNEDGNAKAYQYALKDNLVPGLGTVKVGYECATSTRAGCAAKIDSVTGRELAPAVPDREFKTTESAYSEYINWQDQLWNPSRTFLNRRWWGVKAQLTREQLVKRFGKQLGDRVPLNSARAKRAPELDATKMDPWARADVWEIWNKEEGDVHWYVDGFDELLDRKKDTYGLQGFWPFPEPLVSIVSTSKDIPVAEFQIAKDLYDEIDAITTRITRLGRAVKAAGLTDQAAAESVNRLLKETQLNEVIGIPNWAGYSEKGGFKGLVDWFPIEAIVAAMDKLRDQRSELIQLLYQITGYSDLVRGQQEENGTPGEAQVKARFASVRLQAKQERFAQFITEGERIRAELICKFYDTETILKQSNAQYIYGSENIPLVLQAIALLRDRFRTYRIEVKPEHVALTDFASQKSEALEVMQMMTSYIQAVAPLAQTLPGAAPELIKLLQWGVARTRGGSSAEPIFDQAAAKAEQAQQAAAMQPQQPQPADPRIMAQLAKNQGDKEKITLQAQVDSAHIQQETQAVMERAEHASQLKMRETVTGHAAKAAFTPPKLPTQNGAP